MKKNCKRVESQEKERGNGNSREPRTEHFVGFGGGGFSCPVMAENKVF